MPTLKEAMNDPDAIQRALEAAHKDQQAMKATPTNKDNPNLHESVNIRDEELRDLVDDIVALGTDHPNGVSPDGLKSDGSYAPQNENEAMGLIEAYVNTKVAEVLDRLEKNAGWYSQQFNDEARKANIEDTLVPLSAIQAERAKLTQEEGSDE